MKTIWHTLAVSAIGTHKMQFKIELEKDEAIRLGKEQCVVSGQNYLGTYPSDEIQQAEIEYRSSDAYATFLEGGQKVKAIPELPVKTLSLQKWGNSQGIRLPKDLLEKFGIGDEKKVSFEVEIENGAMKLTPNVEKTPFDRLFEGYEGNGPEPVEKWTDTAVGKEIW